MDVGNELKKLSLRMAFKYLERDPEKNLPHLMEWFDKYVRDDVLVVQREKFRDIIEKKDSSWYQLIIGLWSEVDDEMRQTMFENLLINANALAIPLAKASAEKYGCEIPWAIMIEIGDNDIDGSLDFDQIDDLLEQAEGLGTFMFLLVGKGIYSRRSEIIALCNKHRDSQFMAYTTGEEIDRDFADELLRIKNLILAINVTDDMGERKEAKFHMLKSFKIPFGVYVMYDQENQDRYTDREFYERVVACGGKFAWMISTVDEKLDKVYPVVKTIREEIPLLALDFCKDTLILGKCPGGKYSCFVDATGQVSRCKFLNGTGSNIKDMSLIEAYKSSGFTEENFKDTCCKSQ